MGEVAVPGDQLVIDADAHVIETDDTWEYLEGGEKRFRPRLVSSSDDPGRQYWIVDGKVAGPPLLTMSDQQVAAQSAASARNIGTPTEARKMRDIELRLSHMSELGIDVQVLHNSLWIEQVTERPDVEAALCRSWNRWLADIWRQGRGRLRWTCVLPTMSLDEAMVQMRFAKDNGAVGVCLPPFERDLMMLDPYYYPLYELASEIDLPIIVHIANNDPALVRSLRSRLRLLDGFTSFRMPTVAACYGLLNSEVPATFPKLRWAFVEASAQWVPWIIHELERRHNEKYSPEDNPFVSKKVYVTTQIGDDYKYILDCIGEDRLVIGTDYGHTDTSSEVDAISQFREVDLPDAVKAEVLSTNPAALYGIASASVK